VMEITATMTRIQPQTSKSKSKILLNSLNRLICDKETKHINITITSFPRIPNVATAVPPVLQLLASWPVFVMQSSANIASVVTIISSNIILKK